MECLRTAVRFRPPPPSKQSARLSRAFCCLESAGPRCGRPERREGCVQPEAMAESTRETAMACCTPATGPGLALRDYGLAELAIAIDALALRGSRVHAGVHPA